MKYFECDAEFPSHVLTALEDLGCDLLELQELILAIAASTDNLSPIIFSEPCANIH